MKSTKERGRATRRTERPTIKSERVAARLSPEQKNIFTRAAALRHEPVSQFLVNSAMQAAMETIHQYDMIALSVRDSAAVMQSLLHPEPASPALQRVADRYKAFMQE